MTDNTIAGSGRVKFTKPGDKYHWVRETEWERQWEAEGLLPKRWAVASEPVVISTYRGIARVRRWARRPRLNESVPGCGAKWSMPHARPLNGL